MSRVSVHDGRLPSPPRPSSLICLPDARAVHELNELGFAERKRRLGLAFVEEAARWHVRLPRPQFWDRVARPPLREQAFT